MQNWTPRRLCFSSSIKQLPHLGMSSAFRPWNKSRVNFGRASPSAFGKHGVRTVVFDKLYFYSADTSSGGGATTQSVGGASQNVPIPDAGAVDLDLAKREAPNSSVSWPLFTATPTPSMHDSWGTFVGPCMFSIACGLTVAVLCTMG